MAKMNYLTCWLPEREKTWSGTTFSLYAELKKKYVVNDIDLTVGTWERRIKKALHLPLYFVDRKSTYRRLSYKIETDKLRKVLKKNYREGDINLYVGGDYGRIEGGGYLYTDLSIDSLLYYRDKRPDLFPYAGYTRASDKNFQWRRMVQIESYSQLDGIFPMSKWLAENLVSVSGLPREKVHHIGAGINLDKNEIDYSHKAGNKILFVGRDYIRKGGDLVLQAFRLLAERRPDAELFLIGPSSLPDSLPPKGVHFLGDVPIQKLNEYFNLCDVFCMPSRFEAYGLVFIEALSFGLPCIGRAAYAMPEFIEHGTTGFLVESDDPLELADYMQKLLEDQSYTAAVRLRRDYYLEEYSWAAVAKRVSDVIDKRVRE